MAKDRLYYYDPKLLEFDADVISCEGPCACASSAESWQVQLSPNAFYPESGGQPSDRGKVAGADVIDVTEDAEGRVIVVTSGPVSGRVRCSIDGHRRFDLMQQHTGQHILSAAFERLFGFETVGFHLGEEYCTVDLDTDKLEEWQADKAEDVSNDIVTKDVPVVAEFVDADKLKAMNLRKGAEGRLRHQDSVRPGLRQLPLRRHTRSPHRRNRANQDNKDRPRQGQGAP